MVTSERYSKTPIEYADQFRGGFDHMLFQSKTIRDEVFTILKQRGKSIKKRTTSGQRIHPEYVTDYIGTLETGFGNSQYQTFFGKLYVIEGF